MPPQSRIGTPELCPEKGYMPFVAAVELGRVTPSDLNPHSPQRAAELVMSAKIPDNAGLIDLGNHVAAYDLTAARWLKDGLELLPMDKDGVDPVGRDMQATGLTSLVFENGIIRPVGLAQERIRAEWGHCVNGLRGVQRERRRQVATSLSAFVLQPIAFNRRTDFEVVEITSYGSVIARRPVKFF